MLTAPSIFQYTFFACAPLIKRTFEYVLVVNAPLILMINTAFALPWALRYNESVNTAA